MAGSITTAILSSLGWYKTKKLGGKFFYSLGGLPSDFWGEQDYHSYLKDFIEIPELNAIINYKARMKSRVKIEVVSKETGKPAANNEPLVKLFRRPNWFQSIQELLYQADLYKSIFGNRYDYFLTPSGMGTNYKAWYILPSQCVYIYCPEKLFFLQTGVPNSLEYYFQVMGDTTKYPLETKDILHFNNNRISFNPDKREDEAKLRRNYLYGTSKMASLTPNLKNLRQAHEGRHSLRKLPAGVLTNNAKDMAGTQPFHPDEKDRLQEDLKKYGISLGQYQLILTSLNLRLNQTIVDIDKLKLYEECKADREQIAEEYGVPIELLGTKEGITYENKKYAERQLIEDTCLPETIEEINALNWKFETDKRSWHIVGGYDHLPIFQENREERAQTLQKIVLALNKALQDRAITIEDYKKELRKLGIGEDK